MYTSSTASSYVKRISTGKLRLHRDRMDLTRQVEVVEVVVVVETGNDDPVFAPFPLTDPALLNGNTFSVNDGELSHQEVVL